jgi:hypothetical protein
MACRHQVPSRTSGTKLRKAHYPPQPQSQPAALDRQIYGVGDVFAGAAESTPEKEGTLDRGTRRCENSPGRGRLPALKAQYPVV